MAAQSRRTEEPAVQSRTRARNAMPGGAVRVFALRKKAYPGYGFHHSMEKRLGKCSAGVNDLEDASMYHGDREDVIANQIVLKVIVEELFKRVAEAERSL